MSHFTNPTKVAVKLSVWTVVGDPWKKGLCIALVPIYD